MRQNTHLFDSDSPESRVTEAALRFYAKHEYLHEDQEQFVLAIANTIRDLRRKERDND